jgi:hypothetical protein
MAVYAFAEPNQIHRFLDFTYEHVTIDNRVGQQDGCVIWGAIQTGYLDTDAERVLEQYQEKHLANPNCNGSVYHLTFPDLSPTYSHLAKPLQNTLRLATISAGKVEMINKGILSG